MLKTFNKPFTRLFTTEGPWVPKKRVSRPTMEKIRALASANPEVYNIVELSKEFKLSVEAIRRILKSNYTPDSDSAKRQEKNRYEAMGERRKEFKTKHPEEYKKTSAWNREQKDELVSKAANSKWTNDTYKRPDWKKVAGDTNWKESSNERRSFNRSGNDERRSFKRSDNGERRSYDRDDEKRPFNGERRFNQEGDRRPFDSRSEDRYNDRERRSYNNNYENMERRSYKNNYEDRGRRPYNNRYEDGEKRLFGDRERRPSFNKERNSFERKPFNRDGQTRSFNDEGEPHKRPFPYHDKR